MMTDTEKLEIYGRFVENLKKFDWGKYGKTVEEEDSDPEYVYDEGVKDAVEDLTWHLEVDLAE
jgi:hypothetical protein